MDKSRPCISLLDFLEKYASDEWILLLKNYIEIKKYSKNERIFFEGDKVTGVYFINSGKVKVTTSYDDNNERILRLSKSGDILGHRALSSHTYCISSVTLTPAEITYIPLDIFIKFLKANPEFSIYVVNFIAQELNETEQRMKSIIHNEVIIRLSLIICMLIDAYGFESKVSKKLAFTLSRVDMASFAGTSYESVVRNLAKLEELKLIKIEGKSIIVPKEEELKKFITSKKFQRALAIN